MRVTARSIMAMVWPALMLIPLFIHCGRRLPSVSGPTAEPSPVTQSNLKQWNAPKVPAGLFWISQCCQDNPPYTIPGGWPLITLERLQEFSAIGANATIIRPTTWNEGWDAVTRSVSDAQSLGIWIEVDVLDVWSLRTGGGWPWVNDTCETIQSAPKEYHRRWVFDLVKATGSFSNVLYQIGNEGGVASCATSEDWEVGIRDAIHEAETSYGYQRHLVGTNSEQPQIEVRMDYGIYHQETAIGPGSKPRIINEYRRITPKQYKEELEVSRKIGTGFILWRGEMTDSEWEEAKGYLKAARDK